MMKSLTSANRSHRHKFIIRNIHSYEQWKIFEAKPLCARWLSTGISRQFCGGKGNDALFDRKGSKGMDKHTQS
jgi:hypothetical protein